MRRRTFISSAPIATSLLAAQHSHTSAATELPIRIFRTSENSASQTGELFVGGKFIAHTLELLWKNNQSYVSSIPTGTYRAIVRYDKTDQWRLQLEKVPSRTGVQIHVGNYPTQIEGCVLVGRRVTNTTNTVSESSAAYSDLRKAFYGSDTPNASPDVVVNITIAYGTLRTEFSGSSITASYQDRGQWKVIASGRTATFAESYRDLQHVSLTGKIDGSSQYIRLPLFGGKPAAADSATGPWEEDTNTVSRKN